MGESPDIWEWDKVPEVIANQRVKTVPEVARITASFPFNPLVAGSNPARPTSIIKGLGEILGPFHFYCDSDFMTPFVTR